jgi:hypothetical protein
MKMQKPARSKGERGERKGKHTYCERVSAKGKHTYCVRVSAMQKPAVKKPAMQKPARSKGAVRKPARSNGSMKKTHLLRPCFFLQSECGSPHAVRALNVKKRHTYCVRVSAKRMPKKPTALTQKEESPLSAQIAEYLTTRGIFNERLNSSGKIKTTNGYRMTLCERETPDIFTILCGRAIFIETKISEEKPTPEQLEKHEELRRAGAIVIVADSYEQFIDTFAAIRAALFDQPRETNLYD